MYIYILKYNIMKQNMENQYSTTSVELFDAASNLNSLDFKKLK